MCEICQHVRPCHRHHILDFTKYGESTDGFTWALCPTCHETLHIAIRAIIYKRKRATEVWEALVASLGKDSLFIRQVENKVYITVEMVTEWEIKCYDS